MADLLWGAAERHLLGATDSPLTLGEALAEITEAVRAIGTLLPTSNGRGQ
jgi:hypothetical protein